MSVAKPGYRFTTLTLEGLCGSVPLDECDRSQDAEVVLQPLP